MVGKDGVRRDTSRDCEEPAEGKTGGVDGAATPSSDDATSSFSGDDTPAAACGGGTGTAMAAGDPAEVVGGVSETPGGDAPAGGAG